MRIFISPPNLIVRGFVLIPTVAGFGLYTASLQRLDASSAAISTNAEVAIAVMLSYFTLGERLELLQVVGGLMVMVGVSLLSLPAIEDWITGSKLAPVVLWILKRRREENYLAFPSSDHCIER